MLFRGEDVDKADFLAQRRRAATPASRWLNCCSISPTCCCSMSRPTTWISPHAKLSKRALAAFDGTILCVSHDRYFLDKSVQRMLILQPPDIPL